MKSFLSVRKINEWNRIFIMCFDRCCFKWFEILVEFIKFEASPKNYSINCDNKRMKN